MECICDTININLKNIKDVEIFIDFFNEIMMEDLYDENFILDKSFVFNGEKIWISIQEEPLFRKTECGAQVEYLFKKFAQKYPDITFYGDYSCTYNNCNDVLFITYNYGEDGKIKIREMGADNKGLFMCSECKEEFDDALVYIDEYEIDKTYECPFCKAQLKFNVCVNEYEIKIIK